MKTKKFKGQIYQLNTLYEFSDSGTSWHIETLENICDKGFFETFDERDEVGSSWKMCRSVSGELGTITDAPIELEDGDVCAFEALGLNWVGIFNKGRNSFMNGSNKVCGFGEAVMIVPLIEK